ncbi:MAG: Gfo/Idh/MocA family oxidoreductase [Lachnospiraceae bacterium]|nr:Gfo/Idh/MocA family oxidoreductase [Lachnospiraceae bacterium]
MRAAIVGCGLIAQVHVKALQELRDITLVAAADIRQDRALTFAKQYHCKAYLSLEEMLEEEQIDVLHICTPHVFHVPMIQYALSKGVHVFSEKPPAISPQQYKTLTSLHTDRHLGFCFQNRYNSCVQIARKLLSDGTAGKVLGARAFVTWSRDAAYYTESGWRGKLATEGGGVLINQSIHTMDLLVYLIGTPTAVDARMSNHHLQGIIEVEDTMEACIHFDDKIAIFYATTAYCENSAPLIELSCENMTIRIEDPRITCIYRDGHTETPPTDAGCISGKGYWGSGHLSCITDFYQSIRENRPFAQDLEGIRDTAQLMLATYESARAEVERKLLC